MSNVRFCGESPEIEAEVSNVRVCKQNKTTLSVIFKYKTNDGDFQKYMLMMMMMMMMFITPGADG